MRDLENVRERIIHKLAETDTEFRNDIETHRKLDQEAQELDNLTAQTPDEETRLREIKKLKLHLKDRIERKINELILSDTIQ